MAVAGAGDSSGSQANSLARARINVHSAASRLDRKGFYRYEFNFRTNSPFPSSTAYRTHTTGRHSTNRALRADADVLHRVLRGGQQGGQQRTLECRTVSRLVTRNPIKLGDAGEI